jgi:hypothetical protein
MGAVTLVVGMMGLIASGLGVKSLHAIVVLSLLGAAVLLYLRPVWARPALLTGLATGLVMWLFHWGFFTRLYPGVLEACWDPAALSSVELAGVPVEEVVWGATAGLFLGPLARYCLAPGKRRLVPG